MLICPPKPRSILAAAIADISPPCPSELVADFCNSADLIAVVMFESAFSGLTDPIALTFIRASAD